MSLGAGRTLAQAKINLALRILGKHPDGYHDIETVFLRLALGDDVRVHIRERTRSLRCGVMRDFPQEKNLAYRAAELYAEETGWPHGFEIVIKKRIAIGGGLGGGSADAGAVLRILNTLAEKPMPWEKLCALAARIGSDVPFLASEYAMAMGWGRGDRLLQLPALPSRDVHLFLPPFGIDTTEAYKLLDESRGDAPAGRPELTAEMFESWESVARNSVNDFEPVMRAQWAVFDALLGRGDEHGLFYRLSGSGSTVFKIPGISTRPREKTQPPPPPLAIPQQTKRVVTSTAESVVPVEVLD